MTIWELRIKCCQNSSTFIAELHCRGKFIIAGLHLHRISPSRSQRHPPNLSQPCIPSQPSGTFYLFFKSHSISQHPTFITLPHPSSIINFHTTSQTITNTMSPTSSPAMVSSAAVPVQASSSEIALTSTSKGEATMSAAADTQQPSDIDQASGEGDSAPVRARTPPPYDFKIGFAFNLGDLINTKKFTAPVSQCPHAHPVILQT